MELEQKILGCVYGLAIGDAIGHQVNSLTLDTIRSLFGREGVTDIDSLTGLVKHPRGHHYTGTYSDNTQKSIATATALIRARSDHVEDIMMYIRSEYVDWLLSPDKNHAPKNACRQGIENMNKGVRWKNSGDKESNACIAASSTSPIGIYYLDNKEKLEEIAHAASICTHAHPTGIASGIGTAYLVSLVLFEENPANFTRLLEELGRKYDIDFADKIRQVGHVLDYQDTDKAIRELGEGCVSEEAVALALYCFLKNPRDYRKTVLMAANTNGDSDSIACIAGAISGAYNGLSSIPEKWQRLIENPSDLRDISRYLYESIEKRRANKRKLFLFSSELTDKLFGFNTGEIRITQVHPSLQRYVLERTVRKRNAYAPNIEDVLIIDSVDPFVVRKSDLANEEPAHYRKISPETDPEIAIVEHLRKSSDKAIVLDPVNKQAITESITRLIQTRGLDIEPVTINATGVNEQLMLHY